MRLALFMRVPPFEFFIFGERLAVFSVGIPNAPELCNDKGANYNPAQKVYCLVHFSPPSFSWMRYAFKAVP
jgi:hypothetical protein